MTITIETVKAKDGKVVREKTYLPSGYSGMTRKQQDKALKEQLGKTKHKTKSKKSSQLTRIDSLLKQKSKSRPLLKRSKLTVEIKEREPHSILGEENKFFDREMVSAKKEMYGI